MNNTALYLTVKAEKKFNNLVEYLRHNNTYFAQHINNSRFLEIYSELPYSDKNSIKKVGEEYLSAKEGQIFWEYTSGSSGIPFKCYKTDYERQLLSLHIWKCRRNIDKMVSPNNFMELLGKNASKQIDFSDLCKENVEKILLYFLEKKPRWICLSPTMAYYYALVAKRNNYRCDSIKFIELQGEYIDKNQRTFIEKAFNAKTILQYGMRETWTIAYECPHGYLRILSDIYQLEICDLDENGYGEIIVSSNICKYMPFIKYKTGDVAKISVNSKCECGKVNPWVIKLREGRKANCIEGHENLIADIVFKRIIRKSIKPYGYDVLLITSFRVIQLGPQNFIFEIVRGDKYNAEIEKNIIKNTNKILGEQNNITFQYVDKTNISKNGKHLYISLKGEDKHG